MRGNRNFRELLEARWAANRFLCIELDSDYDLLPVTIRASTVPLFERIKQFNQSIVGATHDFACAFKLNAAYYECHGEDGIVALKQTIQEINRVAPEVPVIFDGERVGIGSKNIGYVRAAFDLMGADAATVHPYFGGPATKPFLDQKDKGVIVICRTSSADSTEFQDMSVRVPPGRYGGYQFDRPSQVPLYQFVAHRVATKWNANNNCAIAVGAANPTELASVRGTIGDLPMLILDGDSQNGDLDATIKAGLDARGAGMLVAASRSIIFASKENDYADAAAHEAENLHLLINQYRKAPCRHARYAS
jgi:orotidine-5'-phosphate decarboxylase